MPNSHLRAGCQYLCCRILRQPQFSSTYLPNEFFYLAWTFHRPAHFALTICAADFSLTNLQLHKFALLIYSTVGMAANTLKHYFGQPAEACTSCTFNIVTPGVITDHVSTSSHPMTSFNYNYK